MIQYRYIGPVYVFNNLVASNWTADTLAVSKNKALSNIMYQYKKKNNLISSAKINMPGKIIEI